MIKIINGDLFTSKANFIVHLVNCKGVMGSAVAAQVAEKFPHVEIEYRKYLHYCKKNKIKSLGTVQYVPSESWAMIMVDTMKNNTVIAYDENYQYIVNLLGQDNYGMGGLHTDLKAMKKAFIDIKKKAKEIGATVAMPYQIGSSYGGENWNEVYGIIQEVFIDEIDVELWKIIKNDYKVM